MTQQPRSNDPVQQAKAAYEEQEKVASKNLEQIVSTQGFAESLALITSNIAALSRMGNTGIDQLVRMSRLAGRTDITRLGRQLARTEDKLEQVLQVVEQLEAELAVTQAERDAARDALGDGADATSSSRAGRSRNRSGNGRAVANSRPRVARSASAAVDASDDAKSGE